MFDSTTYNSIMGTQDQLGSYYGNMENLYTPGAAAVSVTFTEIWNGYAPVGGIAPKYAVTEVDFSRGKAFKTKSPTDLAIEGNGFFVVSDGKRDLYSRNGNFTVKNGALTHPNGLKVKGYALDENGQMKGEPVLVEMGLDPETKLYAGKYTGYKFDEAGIMYGQLTEVDPITKNAVTTEVPIYQLAIASFANPSGLKPSGSTTYAPTENSGPAVVGTAGQGALGRLLPQYLEGASVDYMDQTYKASRAKQQQSANMAVLKMQDEMVKASMQIIK